VHRPTARLRPSIVVAAAVLLAGCANTAPGTTVPSSPSAPDTPAPATMSPSPSAAPSSIEAGQLVSIGDRALWLRCEGIGSPTIIFESGMGGDHRTWERVTPELADSTRTCVYDRAGIGESDPGPEPRTAATAVEDLRALVDVAEIETPLVLVGFSWGGLIAQLYAATHPDQVAGLVLVESNHPREAEQFEEHLTPEQIAEDRAVALDNPEGVDVYAAFAEAQESGPLPDVPLVVITAGLSEGWPPGWDAETFDALRAAQQADLVMLTSQGSQVIAEESGHHVPSQQPDVVVEAVQRVLAAVAGD
jgi:dienelactone hydrolase